MELRIPNSEKKKKKSLTNLNDATNLLLPNGGKILKSDPKLLNPINQLLNPDPSLNPDPFPLLIDLQHPVHQRQVHHPGPRQPDPIRRQPGPDRPYPGPLLVGFLHDLLQLLQVLRLVEDPGLDLVGPAPVGDGVEVLGQWGVAEDLGFLVLGVL